MSFISIFVIGFFFSFIGSIPPGSINISVMQLAMRNKKAAALYFAMAAALVEFVYAGLAVKFQMFLTENTSISSYFSIVSGAVLLILGILNLIKRGNQQPDSQGKERMAGFKKGILISMANPLAIPFWLAVTAYLQSMGWLTLNEGNYLVYVAGISSGTFILLGVVTWLGARFAFIQHNDFIVYRVPGLIFLSMGIYTFYTWSV